MLIELRIENHRSIRDEQALSMESADAADSTDPRPRQVQGYGKRLLPAVALYGANASGKSNVLSALALMRAAVLESHRLWPPEGGVDRDPFAWAGKSDAPSLFEVTVLVAGVRYQYGYVADDDRFIEEWLFAWPGSRKQTWFERDGQSFKFGEHLTGENRAIEQITRPNALFLSAAVQLKHEQLLPLYRWFLSLREVNVARRVPPVRFLSASDFSLGDFQAFPSRGAHAALFDQAGILTRTPERFLDLLRAADVGIVDLKVEKSEESIDESISPASRRRGRNGGIFLRHRSHADDAWLPLEAESQGTRTLYQMGATLLTAIDIGGVLLVDELEASLHPVLAAKVLALFNDPKTNPRHAQILFTTHDTHLLGNLLGEPPLRRDQVWLTEKDPEGGTCLYPLSDYKPRPSENLERGYLQGRYGAIPFLGDLVAVGDPADGQ
jgi:hypothetical protein